MDDARRLICEHRFSYKTKNNCLYIPLRHLESDEDHQVFLEASQLWVADEPLTTSSIVPSPPLRPVLSEENVVRMLTSGIQSLVVTIAFDMQHQWTNSATDLDRVPFLHTTQLTQLARTAMIYLNAVPKACGLVRLIRHQVAPFNMLRKCVSICLSAESWTKVELAEMLEIMLKR